MQLLHLPRPAKILILVFVDALMGGLAFWLAALARTGSIPAMSPHYAVAATSFAMMLVPSLGFICGHYKAVVRFQIPHLLARAGLVSALTGALIALIGFWGGASYAKAIGLGSVFALVIFVLIVLSRHAARWMLRSPRSKSSGTPVAVFGAGDAGRQLVEVLRRGKEHSPVFFIDDDSSLQGRTIEGLPVIGLRERNFSSRLVAKGVQEILLAIPSVSNDRRRQILEFLSELPFHVRSIPRLSHLLTLKNPAQGFGELREVAIEELLGRDPVSPLAGLLERCVTGKVVLVSGGGGSIGSELCRQIIELRPARLIVLDHSEFSLYQLERELTGRTVASDENARSRVNFVLASITNSVVLESLLKEHQVDTIYHAAAYKHVPIVENNPLAGLHNNVIGTWHLARAALKSAVKHFVLISSDKAVRPTNVMGATKRMAELVIQMLAAGQPKTVFSMVRFGNVLDSSGSVVPLFRQQIERGGPITLTHPDVTRYFMTIREAVQLVIQAGAMARGGEVYVLDMGTPVRIKDLATKMIHLSGRTVRDEENAHADISIELVGLRPGEKLHEELLISGKAAETAHPRIRQALESDVDSAQLESDLLSFHADMNGGILRSENDMRLLLKKWVIGYTFGPGVDKPEISGSSFGFGAVEVKIDSPDSAGKSPESSARA